ncbi:hypothetical protein [Hymenobacter persicinus]|uniref:STAS/SEC14 domain-containing protein n=1 Tax=Hymenobacter persicinus TaxID=2025506 RepID=A0A4Q5L9Y0_9BACT|nr:hypothetical protein [Hymenobacter persicinus]RYU78611.1 hypothetical protein EWM57_13280 [Hymenobacter persicinus]
MPLPSLDLSYLRLTYRPDLRTLFLRWTRSVSSPEHREGYQQALTMAQPLEAGRWLIDLRTRGLASAEDFEWVLTDFRAQLAQALPHVTRRLAYLVTPYHQATIRERMQSPELADNIRVFIEEAPAQHWLETGL